MDEFAFEIAETARALRRGFDRRVASLGVTRAQWRVLAWLAREEGIRQIDLAERLDVEPITLCRMIDRLASADLVERRRDSADRRAWRLYLTTRAGPVVEQLREVADLMVTDALRGVLDAEREQVRAVLGRIRANVAGAAVTAQEHAA